ncbi:MAG: hypothetical protein KA419_00970 [Acidobacteria bacterium]|nr:hypothetical protein [Acidobacteriota bacterium]
MDPILANAGLPMIIVQLPLMVCALIPVIVLEALLIRRWVKLSYRDAFIGIARANLASTFVGVLLAWVFALFFGWVGQSLLSALEDRLRISPFSATTKAIEFVLQAAWLIPRSGAHADWVIVPAAAAILLVPCFYVSLWIERKECLKAWPGADPAVVIKGVYRVNVVSYGALFLLACAYMIVHLIWKGR